MISDEVKTLLSLRSIEGTNAYVMDYYCDYNIDVIRTAGIKDNDVEGTFFEMES